MRRKYSKDRSEDEILLALAQSGTLDIAIKPKQFAAEQKHRVVSFGCVVGSDATVLRLDEDPAWAEGCYEDSLVLSRIGLRLSERSSFLSSCGVPPAGLELLSLVRRSPEPTPRFVKELDGCLRRMEIPELVFHKPVTAWLRHWFDLRDLSAAYAPWIVTRPSAGCSSKLFLVRQTRRREDGIFECDYWALTAPSLEALEAWIPAPRGPDVESVVVAAGDVAVPDFRVVRAGFCSPTRLRFGSNNLDGIWRDVQCSLRADETLDCLLRDYTGLASLSHKYGCLSESRRWPFMNRKLFGPGLVATMLAAGEQFPALE